MGAERNASEDAHESSGKKGGIFWHILALLCALKWHILVVFGTKFSVFLERLSL
jgi:hypothetical protein